MKPHVKRGKLAKKRRQERAQTSKSSKVTGENSIQISVSELDRYFREEVIGLNAFKADGTPNHDRMNGLLAALGMEDG